MLVVWLWASGMVISLNSFLFHQIYLSLLVNIPSSKSLNTSLVARYTFAHVITGSNNLRYLWFQCPWYISVTLSKPKRKSSLGLELAIHFAHLVKLNKLPIRSFDSRQLSPACLERKGDWLSHIKDGLSKVFKSISRSSITPASWNLIVGIRRNGSNCYTIKTN